MKTVIIQMSEDYKKNDKYKQEAKIQSKIFVKNVVESYETTKDVLQTLDMLNYALFQIH